MFDRAATRAATLARSVDPGRSDDPTPCSEWNIASLLEHLAGGCGYLLAALGADPSAAGSWPDATVVAACVAALREEGALERRCMSPAGFEWSVAEAAAGTAMDQLIHTWDLAIAVGGEHGVDPDVTDAVVSMFLPQMPEVGRQAGFVGPEIAVAPSAPALDRLLGAMGRNPGR